MTCCDRFDRNCDNIDSTEAPIPTEQCWQRMPWWLTQSKAVLKSICTILASCPLSNAPSSVLGHTKKCITGTQTIPISKLGGWKHTTVFHESSKTNRHWRLNTLENTDVIEIGRQLATYYDGGRFGIGVTLACLQQAGKHPDEQAAETLH